MQYYVYAHTEIGNTRENNEDTLVVGENLIINGSESTSCDAPFITAVCDGVGGENGGEIASFFVAKRLSECNKSEVSELKDEIIQIHRDLVDYGNENYEYFGLQTTMCCLKVCENGKLYCLNTGDSRLYLYKNKKARQISKDHSYVMELYEKGKIKKSELKNHPQKNIITSSVGNPYKLPKVDVCVVSECFCEGCVVVLCSDGVSDFVGEREIEAAMELEVSFDEKIHALSQLALERGSTDNVSVIGVKLN
ncbi:MAG: serine/threonine-protein phosphatase [Ruminococcus sp.]|nr:serine/threonine-protein phosphatase [Ruminococcus sp.]